MSDPRAPETLFDGRFSDPAASATPWDEVRSTLERAELFWISTVRADGRPHVTPLTPVWLDGALYFCTGAAEQKAVNIAHNAACVLTTGNNAWRSGLDVVIEGTAQRVTDHTHLQRLASAWYDKFEGLWKFDVDNGAFQGEGGEALVFEVAPTKILAFAKDPSGQTSFRFAQGRAS